MFYEDSKSNPFPFIVNIHNIRYKYWSHTNWPGDVLSRNDLLPRSWLPGHRKCKLPPYYNFIDIIYNGDRIFNRHKVHTSVLYKEVKAHGFSILLHRFCDDNDGMVFVYYNWLHALNVRRLPTLPFIHQNDIWLLPNTSYYRPNIKEHTLAT